MGWKGTLRSVNAAIKASERDAIRRQKLIEKRAKEIEKMQELERANFEVEKFENYIEVIRTVHTDVSGYTWESLKKYKEPINNNQFENLLRKEIQEFKPTLVEKFTKTGEKRLNKLKSKLNDGIERDLLEFNKSHKKWIQDKEEYQEAMELLKGLKMGNRDTYLKWMSSIDPFKEISEIGRHIKVNFDGKEIEVNLIANSIDDIVPLNTKSLLKSGKLSIKKMPCGKRYDLYQDHICSSSIRLAREMFNVLPIDRVVVNSNVSMLNTSNGLMEDTLILSVFYVRDTIENMNLLRIDPSDSLINFIHNIKFKKTKGFERVEKVSL